MKTIRTTIILSALALLGGCMAVPVAPDPYAGPGYYAPAPVLVVPRVYVGPSFGIGIYGGGHHRGGPRWRH